MEKGDAMKTETTERFTADDFDNHVATYRMFVKGVAIAAGSALFILIVLAYATMR